MAKYHQLVEKYQIAIDNLKAAEAEAERLHDAAEMVERLANAEAHEPWDYPYDKVEVAWHAWEKAQHLADVLADGLQQDLEHEYWDVPFAKTRKQGIAGFYREAGLS